jgi:hypothetical protein
MAKLTQTSTMVDNNNCTVLALKSVTGWQERKCHRILSEGGRKQNRGFDIEGYLADCKGKINDVTLTPFYMDWKLRKPGTDRLSFDSMSLKQFAEKNPKGVFYIIIRAHALAIIDGNIVDNLAGKMAGPGRHVQKAYKVTGNIKPNMGKVHKLDTKPKRHARLRCGETVTYLGSPLKNKFGKVLAKKGDKINIVTQHANGQVSVRFQHRGEAVPHPTMKQVYSFPDGWSYTFKMDRSFFQVLKERKHLYNCGNSQINNR